MPDINHRRVAAVAVLSTLALIAFAAEAGAKSKQAPSKSRAASVSRTLPGSGGYVAGAGGYNSSAGMGAYIPPPRRSGGGVVNDNTAGWGNVGAF